MDTHLPPSHPQYRIIQAKEFDVTETLSSRHTGGWKGTSWKPERELDRNMDVSKAAMQRAAERFPGRPMQIHAQVAKGWTYVELDRSRTTIISSVDQVPLAIIPAVDEEIQEIKEYLSKVLRGMGADGENSLAALDKYKDHCRGDHLSLSTGITRGAGSQAPHDLGLEKRDLAAIHQAFGLPQFERCVKRVMESFKTHYPKLNRYYQETMTALGVVDGLQNVLAPGSVFGSTSWNVGRAAVSKWHVDCMNLLLGVCAIVVLGHFDHTVSGHLWLNECRTILEVAPGDVIFIPSSLLGHKNSPIQPEEDRQSIVFHSSYSLFQWVEDQHVQHQKALQANLGSERLTGKARIAQGLKRLGRVSRFCS